MDSNTFTLLEGKGKGGKTTRPKTTTPKNLNVEDTTVKNDVETDLAQMYQMKTDKQHVLDNPDTYTGSMDLTDYDTYIYNE